MATKRITLNELKELVKQVIKEEYENNILLEGEDIDDFFNFLEVDPHSNTISYLYYVSTLDGYLSKPKENPMVGKFIKVTRYKFNYGQTYKRAVELKNPEYTLQKRSGEYTKVQGYSVIERDARGEECFPIVPKESKSSILVLDENDNVIDIVSTKDLKEKYQQFFRPSFFGDIKQSSSGSDFRALKARSIIKISAGGKTWTNPHFKFEHLGKQQLLGVLKEETEKAIFNLYHMKSLSPSETEMVLVDKTGNNIYLYKKEKDSWVLYDADMTNGKLRPTTSHRMNRVVVNVLPFKNALK